MIALWLLAACLPETYTITTDMFDIAGECWDRDVVVTLETKYWKEWYFGDCDDDEGGGMDSVWPTSDERCMEYVACADRTPLWTDDPHFTDDHDAIVTCTEKAARGEGGPYPDCSPAMPEWP